MNEQENKIAPKLKKKPSKGLLHEYGTIVAILADAFLKQIMEQGQVGKMEAFEIINEAAINFYKEYEKRIENPKTDWMHEIAPYNVPGYDDFVLIHCSRYLMNTYYSLTLKINPF